MVCYLPLLCDFSVYFFAVPLQREIYSFLNRQRYGKDFFKWRREGG